MKDHLLRDQPWCALHSTESPGGDMREEGSVGEPQGDSFLGGSPILIEFTSP